MRQTIRGVGDTRPSPLAPCGLRPALYLGCTMHPVHDLPAHFHWKAATVKRLPNGSDSAGGRHG